MSESTQCIRTTDRLRWWMVRRVSIVSNRWWLEWWMMSGSFFRLPRWCHSLVSRTKHKNRKRREEQTKESKMELIYCHVDVVQAKILGPTVDGTEIHRTGVHFMTGIVEANPSIHRYSLTDYSQSTLHNIPYRTTYHSIHSTSHSIHTGHYKLHTPSTKQLTPLILLLLHILYTNT